MQEVVGSIPISSTILRQGFGWQAELKKSRRTKLEYVYILQSLSDPSQHYTGLTDDISSRLAAHNAGQVSHTSKYKPWKIVTYVAFEKRTKAAEFEQYLKSGSGRAFASKRLRG